jgi:NagD protein
MQPFYVGKPSSFMIRAALHHLQTRTDNTLMVGDNMDTDIIAGIQAGMETALVLTGVSQKEDLGRYAYRPHQVVENLAELAVLLARQDQETPSS